MNLIDVLNHIIDDGIEAARADYAKPRDTLKREGAIQGFEECRGKDPAAIAALLGEASARTWQARLDNDPRYWFWRCRAVEIEWVADVLSCIMLAQGWPPIGMMTTRGAMKAAEIIGVAER